MTNVFDHFKIEYTVYHVDYILNTQEIWAYDLYFMLRE